MNSSARSCAVRPEHIVGPYAHRIGDFARLPPREPAVLRLASNGIRTR